MDYQAMLVHQRGDEGFLDRYTPEAVKARATAEAKQAQDDAELQRQVAAGGGKIQAPPSTIDGLRHPDLRGLESPVRVAEAAGDYVDALRLNRAALGALRELVSGLALVPGRKSLVLVSEGIIDDPEVGELAQVLDAARAANAVLYFLDLRGLTGSGYTAEARKPASLTVATLLRQGAAVGTERLADDTGGRTLAGNDLAAGLRRVAAEAHSYYLLGYEPPESGRAGERKVAVRVRKPSLTVRTRPAWRAEAGVPSPPSSKSPPDALDLLARSGADLAEVPLALSSHVFDETAPGRARVVVAADLDLPPAKAGTEVAFRMVVVPLAEGTGLQHGGTEALEPAPELPWTGGFGTHAPLARSFELAPGRYQARLAVEVAGRARRRGTGTVTFDVPPLGGLRLSSPIVTDRLGERLDRAPRPVVRGLPAFWPSATLYCQFEVYGASGHSGAIDAGYTVRGPDGKVVRTVAPTRIQPTPDDRLLRLVGFPLSGFSPGVYSLAVDVRDETSGAVAAGSDSFRVFDVRR
jgi:VWFA-related protein